MLKVSLTYRYAPQTSRKPAVVDLRTEQATPLQRVMVFLFLVYHFTVGLSITFWREFAFGAHPLLTKDQSDSFQSAEILKLRKEIFTVCSLSTDATDTLF